MPFKSEKQRRYLWSQKPEVARRFADDEKLPWTHKKMFGKRVDKGRGR